ncbi:hypothetical protein DXG03_002331, partial [Asterophora parasitica]
FNIYLLQQLPATMHVHFNSDKFLSTFTMWDEHTNQHVDAGTWGMAPNRSGGAACNGEVARQDFDLIYLCQQHIEEWKAHVSGICAFIPLQINQEEKSAGTGYSGRQKEKVGKRPAASSHNGKTKKCKGPLLAKDHPAASSLAIQAHLTKNQLDSLGALN